MERLFEKERIRSVSIFDLDMTITNRDTFRFFLLHLYLEIPSNRKHIPAVLFWALARKLRLISLKKFKEKSLAALKGMSAASILEKGRSFFEASLLSTIREKARQTIAHNRKNGHFIYILTGSPDVYVKAFSEHLGCDGYGCSRLLYQNRRFAGNFSGQDCAGNEKARRLKCIAAKFGIDLKGSYAYSDHEADLPMLELVGNPVAVSPTKYLHHIARQRGWKIEWW
jgi:HAD superfamily hydrolase (TIGR01490 family)